MILVLPSSIDINATANFLRELLLAAKVKTAYTPIHIVANRIKARTTTLQALERFLAGLRMPVAAYLRDTVNYARAAEVGMGVHELSHAKANKDSQTWDGLMAAIDRQWAMSSSASVCA